MNCHLKSPYWEAMEMGVSKIGYNACTTISGAAEWSIRVKFIKQLAIILTISLIAELMEHLIPIPVAASIYGLILMLVALITKIIPLEKVEGAADFLVEIMPILFIPPTVSIMANVEALKQMLIPLCIISIVSTILIMGFTGRVSQSILRKSQEKIKN